MITRLSSLPEEWRQRRRYARLRRAMRRGTLLEVIGDFDVNEGGARRGGRRGIRGCEPLTGRVGGLGKVE